MLISRLELYFKKVIENKKKGVLPSLLKAVLLPISWLYALFIRARNHFYEKGWMLRYTPPVPLVISVGNIVVGGTGKTPVTLLIAEAFYQKFSLAILSRGYRSKAEHLDNPVILCQGEGPLFPAGYCGDEPYLLAQRLPKAIVIVGGDRRKSSFLAAKAGAQIILLDDALQHRRLARDFDVIVIDSRDPFGQEHYLPRGFLRDERRSLKRAHLIVLNHVATPEAFAEAKEKIAPYSDAPVVGTQGHIVAYRDLAGHVVTLPGVSPQKVMASNGAAMASLVARQRSGGEELMAKAMGDETDERLDRQSQPVAPELFEGLPEKKAAFFCAIAQPDNFRHSLEEAGFTIVADYILSDHEPFRENRLQRFAEDSKKKGAEWLICTEKDRVKLHPTFSSPLPILWAQLELQIVFGREEWDRFLNETTNKLHS